MIFSIVWLSCLFVMFYPEIDLFLDFNMSYHMVIQPLVFICFGYLLGKKINVNFGVFNVFGVSGLIFFLGNYIFWMIPRSLELTLINSFYDKICHLSFIVSGLVLSRSFLRMAFFIRASFGIHFLAMFSSLGLFYSVYASQTCTSYSLIQQKEAGAMFLFIAIPLWLSHLYWIFMGDLFFGKKS